MTATQKGKPSVVSIEALLRQDRDLFKQLLRESIQEVGCPRSSGHSG